MLKAMSTYVMVKERLHPGMLDRLARGGAQALEIFCARNHFDYTDRGHVREIAGWFQANNVAPHSLHSPMHGEYEHGRASGPPLNIADMDKRRRIESMDEIKRAVEVAETIPFRFLVQHIGISGESFHGRKFDDAMTAVEHLRAFAKPLGVTLLLENIPNELSEPERLVELIRTAHFDDVGICFDFGHAHFQRYVASDFKTLRDYIRSTHVHDNLRDRDAHRWPGEGSIDWAEAMELLRSARHAPPLLLEIEGVEGINVTDKMSEVYRMLEKISVSKV